MSTISGSGCELLRPLSDRKPLEEIERSLIKTYRSQIWSKFVKAIKEFKLIEKGDRIAVGISGGKDSLLMAKLFQEIQRHGKIPFELEFIVMDPGYYITNKELLENNCEYLNIPIRIYESGIFKVVDKIANDYPCYMCAKMRRGFLYAKAQELNCNKLALGHHFNDVIETTLMNVLYAGSFQTMLPKLKSLNFEGLELIRPLYYVEEEHIKNFTVNAGLSPLNCGCVVAAKKTSSKRREIKDLIKQLKETSEDVDKCILKAAHNVNLNCIVGWKKDGQKHSYIDEYEEIK
ncbi:MAG: tRNA 2-thiocytidine(32) synthetase TtcA [Firmicutes bacterium HGW-Firmicutes-1]|jgi:tRNA(Ile)-lysidine synthase TilS/MesJ|nr:MAG: tRNA 2-thiocytidine(32) synthetase TtcA [Firmicutes bacterium HGW-Firmicutes-1]